MPDEKTTDVLIDVLVPNPTTVLREENIRRSPQFLSVYSNHTAFNTSAFDFGMTFGEITPDEKGQLGIEQKVRVVMSPLHAKIFAAIVMNNVRNYEAQFGEIKVPVPQEEKEEAKSPTGESATPEDR